MEDWKMLFWRIRVGSAVEAVIKVQMVLSSEDKCTTVFVDLQLNVYKELNHIPPTGTRAVLFYIDNSKPILKLSDC